MARRGLVTITFVQHQRMIVMVHHALVHQLLQLGEVDHHPVLRMVLFLPWTADQGNVQYVGMPMDACAEAIVASERVGHFEVEPLGDANRLVEAHGNVSKCAVK